jgi:hypothetical protein
MRFSALFTTGALAAICMCMQGQSTQDKEAPSELKGMPPRATPADYQAHAQAGRVTVAAEFSGHSAPTREGPLASEDYVVVEAAVFGDPGTRANLSRGDFSLRVNEKKNALPSQSYVLVAGSLRDPEWVPPEEKEAKEAKEGKNSLKTGGSGDQVEPSTPVHVVVPVALQRAWTQRVQKVVLPEGDRPLPLAGLLFFRYRGKAESIYSLELIYAGAAGKATLKLQ